MMPARVRPKHQRARSLGVIVGALAMVTSSLVAPVQAGTAIVVDSLADAVVVDGNCTLREAILAANADVATDACPAGSGADVITFAVSGTIDLAAARRLPPVTGTLAIDGLGQSISVANGLSPVGEVDGGAIRNDGTLTLRNLRFSQNRAARGGAVANLGTLTVERVTFYNNGNSQEGGALYTTGPLIVRDSTFDTNYTGPASQGASGGAIANSGGTLTIERSTFFGNISAAVGGAIWSYGAASISNSTFNQNGFLANFGGAIENRGTMTITGSTFGRNRAWQGAAVHNSDFNNASTTIINSIFADSADGTDCSETIVDGGYNISEDGSCVSAATSLTGDPGLAALLDNGGPTKTQAVPYSSIAVDAIPAGTSGCGSTMVEDQRGVARPKGGGCDIGAFEFFDNAAPTSSIVLSPATPDGLNDWHVSPVWVRVTAADETGGSGLLDIRCATNPIDVPASYADLPACPDPGTGLVVYANGPSNVYASASDNVGNEEAVISSTFKLDTVAPTLTCTSGLPMFELGDVGAISATIFDATSGPAAATTSELADTSTLGRKNVALYGSDLAGNSGQTACGYVVGYRFLGFSSPSDRSVRAGAKVNVIFALGLASGTPIPDADAAALVASCSVQISLDGDASSSRCATYDRRKDRFTFSLTLPQATEAGAHTLTVRVLAGGDLLNADSTTITVSSNGKPI